MTLAQQDFSQLDVVWLAADPKGFLAAFVTAGAGPIPPAALPFVAGAEEAALRLPSISECQLLMRAPRPDDFAELAKRGLFVYDWSDIHRTTTAELRAYELVAVPARPIVDLEASSEIQERVSGVVLPEAIFGSSSIAIRDVVV